MIGGYRSTMKKSIFFLLRTSRPLQNQHKGHESYDPYFHIINKWKENQYIHWKVNNRDQKFHCPGSDFIKTETLEKSIHFFVCDLFSPILIDSFKKLLFLFLDERLLAMFLIPFPSLQSNWILFYQSASILLFNIPLCYERMHFIYS